MQPHNFHYFNILVIKNIANCFLLTWYPPSRLIGQLGLLLGSESVLRCFRYTPNMYEFKGIIQSNKVKSRPNLLFIGY